MLLHDVTLREGEQRSGQSYSVDQKVRSAEILDALGVDYIQIGFPIAQDGTKEACERLDIDAKVSGMARALERDVDVAVDAGIDVIDIGIPVSDLQREQILGIDRSELVERSVELSDYALDRGIEVHFSAMDSFRADTRFLDELVNTVDVPLFTLLDTVGIATPINVVDVIEEIGRDPAHLGVHFHRDLGVATANVLAAAQCGVKKADVSVGGIGDRVGNASLEEVVVAGTVSRPNIDVNVDLARLIPRCLELLEVLGEVVPANKPILGELAFEHEAGMHTAAMLDEPSTFEAFDPTHFGGERRLLFGPSSGRGAARRLLQRVGVTEPSDDVIASLLDRLRILENHVEVDRALSMAEAVEDEMENSL